MAGTSPAMTIIAENAREHFPHPEERGTRVSKDEATLGPRGSRRRASARLLTTRVGSITPRPRQLVGVEVGVAEQLLADPRALHEEADVELVGHAHATMHLHAFLNRQRRG